jgi:hypothetical protein
MPDFAQFAADELGDELLEELVHVEQEREGFSSAGTGKGKVRRMKGGRDEERSTYFNIPVRSIRCTSS